MSKKLQAISACILLCGILSNSSCKKKDIITEEPAATKAVPGFGNTKLPLIATEKNAEIIYTNTKNVSIYNGGYGSAIAQVNAPGKNNWFYMLTDRGPNVDGAVADSKVFPLPGFNPQIGLFRLEGDSLRKVSVINLKDKAGNLLTGLPNPAGLGGTGEKAFDVNGHLLSNDPNGIDSEGLIAMADGSFWVSDEYGPHIIHFDGNGNTIERISPFINGTGVRTIPKVFAKRRANRGMEGITITPDDKWLVGIMQSPLDNPKASGRAGKTVRILFFNTEDGTAKQYLYQMESRTNLISDITALSSTEFLVLERDGNFPLFNEPASSFKKIYKFSINEATDVSDAANSEKGLLVNGKTIEELTDNLSAAGIKPATKSLVLDIIAAFPDYAHDKPEGLALIGDMLVISNDADFGIVDDGAGDFKAKYLPWFSPVNKPDFGQVHFIKLTALSLITGF